MPPSKRSCGPPVPLDTRHAYPDDDLEWSDCDVLGVQDLSLGRVGDLPLVGLLTASEALIARVQAIQLRAIEELRRRRGRDRDTADEVGLALSVSRHTADRRVDLARELATRFPETHAAMQRGELDAAKAARVIDTAGPLTDDLARELDAQLSGLLAGRDASAIQQSARYRVERLDPEGAADRAERLKRRRKVELLPGADGMADLVGYLPADVACAAYARVDAIAKSNKSRDDERSLDEIRADVFSDLLLGQGPVGPVHRNPGHRAGVEPARRQRPPG